MTGRTVLDCRDAMRGATDFEIGEVREYVKNRVFQTMRSGVPANCGQVRVGSRRFRYDSHAELIEIEHLVDAEVRRRGLLK